MKHGNVWIDTFKGLPSAQQKTAAKTQHFAAAENTFMPVYYDKSSGPSHYRLRAICSSISFSALRPGAV